MSNAVKIMLLKTVFLIGISSNAFSQHFEDGKLIFPERRIAAFAYKGADEEIIRSTLPRILTREGGDPGSWVYEWSYLGGYYETEGANHEKNNQLSSAKNAYMTASNYYAMAWFPFNYSPEEKQAYNKHLETYQKAGQFFDEPMEVALIPFDNETITLYLHKPKDIKNPPLVLWTQGADQYKANAYVSVNELVKKGIAVGTFDLLGFGENEKWISSPTSDELHIKIMEYFIERGDVDESRISFVGFSWGGYYAAKLATRNDPRIRSIVSFCGPIHEMFAASEAVYEDMLNGPEGPTLSNLLRRLGVQNPDSASMKKTLNPFSLVEQGLIGQGKTIKTRLLIANGTQDDIQPVSDLELLHDSAENSDLWLLGRADHCAAEYLPVAVPQMADWILEN